jgi:hypothetical protein
MSDLTTAEYALLAQDFAARYADGYIGVGDGETAFTGAETDLQGTNKARRAISAYTVSGSLVTFFATFPAGVASFTWNEAAVFAQASGGHMAGAKVINSPGTKPANEEWSYSLEIDLAPA